MRADEELETGVADYTADFCEYVVDDSAADCKRKILTFVKARLDVLDQEGEELASDETDRLREQHEAAKRDLALAEIDHIFSGGYAHPANLFVDFHGPNQSFGGHNFQRGKWLYYGEDVLEAASLWIRQAVKAVRMVVKPSV